MKTTERKYHGALVPTLDSLDKENPGYNYALLILGRLAQDTHVPADARGDVIDALTRAFKNIAPERVDTVATTVQVDRAIQSIKAQVTKSENGDDKGEHKVATKQTGPDYAGVHG